MSEPTYFHKSGKVLHLDGDNNYLEMCLEKYRSFNMDIIGKCIPEKEQPLKIRELLLTHKPDILVLTGHDGVLKGDNYLNIENYRNSKYFVASVKEARKLENCKDSLVIFAGACQSLYKDIIDAGANFASSPYRVLIHALDPVFVCQKISFSSANTLVKPLEIVKSTLTGSKGIGGIETRGQYREGYPADPYK